MDLLYVLTEELNADKHEYHVDLTQTSLNIYLVAKKDNVTILNIKGRLCSVLVSADGYKTIMIDNYIVMTMSGGFAWLGLEKISEFSCGREIPISFAKEILSLFEQC